MSRDSYPATTVRWSPPPPTVPPPLPPPSPVQPQTSSANDRMTKRIAGTTSAEQEHLKWQQAIWKSCHNFRAIAAACSVYTAGGLKLAWSVYETPSGKFLSNQLTHLVIVSWFIGALMGVLIAAMFVQRVTKNLAHYCSSALLCLGGLLFVICPTVWLAVVASCLFEGCALGVTQVQGVITASEVAPKEIRGLFLSMERVFLWLGICWQLLYSHFWYKWEPASGHRLHIDQLHGVFVIILALLSFLLAMWHREETPIMRRQQFYMRQQSRTSASTIMTTTTMMSTSLTPTLKTPSPFQRNDLALKRLLSVQFVEERGDSGDENDEAIRAEDEFREMLSYDVGLSLWSAFWRRNAWPLFKICGLRCFATLSLSYPFNRAFMTLSDHGFRCERNCMSVLALCGLLGSIFGAVRIDIHGRRRVSVSSILCCSVGLFIIGGVFSHHSSGEQTFKSINLEMAACLLLFYQLFSAMGVATLASVYTGEAFTLSLKGKCVATLLASEQLMQIILACVIFADGFSGDGINKAVFFFSMGTWGLVLGLMIFWIMPETRHLTLAQCLLKFRKFP